MKLKLIKLSHFLLNLTNLNLTLGFVYPNSTLYTYTKEKNAKCKPKRQLFPA